jgi:hypothetical protein
MKKYIKIIIAFFVGIISSCSLDEHNPSTVGLDLSYKYKTGFEGLVNSCYVNLYYLYGKVDGIGPMEMGTDLWTNVAGNETGFILYNPNLNTSLGTLKTMWQGLYSMINLCNTAIYYSPGVVDYASEAERNAKVAEAYFLRGWAYYHIVEQFGGVVLNTQSMVEAGARSVAQRSDESDFYDLIISDLQFACEHLPINQSERGRVSKKAAYAMLSKAALQRTRLGDKETYAKMALDAAEELIKNQAKYGCALYESDATTSGYAKLWDGNNNKNNSEFLFVEVVDHESALNPEGWNRGRTRQYYETDLKTVGSSWGMTEKSLVYGRANSRYFKPTKYLLTDIFDPREDTPDTRFENTFFYKYYSYNQATITAGLIDAFDKDESLLGHVIPSSAAKGSESDVMEANYYASIGWTSGKLYEGFRNLENDASMAIFTPNWIIPDKEKAFIPALVNDPSDMFQANGKWVEHVQRKEIYPSLKKFSNIKYAYTEQYHMGDFPILRLGDIYLVAAEAALLYNNDKSKAATYVNTLRRRAALTSRQEEMIVNENDMTIDFILAERGRELAGEQWRWYDLKRTAKLSEEYFKATNPDITEFDPAKHLVRPIPVSFLNAISNADEFGTNGY